MKEKAKVRGSGKHPAKCQEMKLIGQERIMKLRNLIPKLRILITNLTI